MAVALGRGMKVDLVERARAGDHEAFAVLIEISAPRLHGTARLILRDPDLAQDAVQEALVLAWRHIGALRDPRAWDGWLYRLTIRACRRAAKTNRRRDVVELHIEPKSMSGALDPAHDLAERDRLARELDRLPVEQRMVVALRFFLDLPLPEVANILGIPLGTAKSRLHRGLQGLRQALEHDQRRLRLVEDATGMTDPITPEPAIVRWLAEEGAAVSSDDLIESVLEQTRRIRPLPRWVGLMREPEVRSGRRVVVGLPRRRLLLAAALAALVAGVAAVGASLLRPDPDVGETWHGYRGNAGRTGLGIHGPTGNPGLSWRLTAGGAVSSAIAIADGTVLVPSDDGVLHAVSSATGDPRWTLRMPAPIHGPFVDRDRISRRR